MQPQSQPPIVRPQSQLSIMPSPRSTQPTSQPTNNLQVPAMQHPVQSDAFKSSQTPEEAPCDDFQEAVRRLLPFPQLARAFKKQFFSGPDAPVLHDEPTSYATESSESLATSATSSWSFRRSASTPPTPRRSVLHRRGGSSRSSITSPPSATTSDANSANVSDYFASSSASSQTNLSSLHPYAALATHPFLRDQALDIFAARIVLTLDGGGIRGVFAIIALKQIDDELKKWGLHLRDCVDIIGGTSTGGIAAIMYSLLDLPLDRMLEKYFSVADFIFGKTKTPLANFFFTGSKHSSDRQRKTYTKVVEETLGDPTAKLRDQRLTRGIDVDEVRRTTEKPFIPMFVVTIDTADVRLPVILSSYEASHPADDPSHGANIPIVDAAIATSAAPTFFHSLHHEGREYIDGGVGFNNPTEIAIKQLKILYGEQAYPHTVLSFGTGRRHKNPFKAACLKRSRFGIRSGIATVFKMMHTFASMSTDSETIHNRVQEYFQERKMDGYYRFNLDSLADIGLDDHKSVTKAVEMSKEYLRKPETRAMVNEIVERILENVAARAALGLARGTVSCADG